MGEQKARERLFSAACSFVFDEGSEDQTKTARERLFSSARSFVFDDGSEVFRGSLPGWMARRADGQTIFNLSSGSKDCFFQTPEEALLALEIKEGTDGKQDAHVQAEGEVSER